MYSGMNADEGHCSGWHSVHRIAVRSGVQDCASHRTCENGQRNLIYKFADSGNNCFEI